MNQHLAVALLLASPVFAQGPDLIARNIDRANRSGDWQLLRVQGSVDVSVRNVGASGTLVPFGITLFEDTNRDGQFTSGVDREFGSAVVAPLAGSTNTQVTIAVAQTSVRFRDDLLWAAVDPANTVLETDESNNLWDTGRQSIVQTQPGRLQPVLEWSWTAATVQPTALNVNCTPAVGDLDRDGYPEIVFGSTASTGGEALTLGYLRILDGRTGTLRTTVTAPTIASSFSPAIGNLDGDAQLEIVALVSAGNRLVCFEHDGTQKWQSAVIQSPDWGSAAIANLDGAGLPEIVVGRQVLDANGNLLWTGTGSSARNAWACSSIVADVDVDGAPEVVAGGTIYSNSGTIRWNNPAGDGFPAVANFDGDPQAEIALVSSGSVRLFDHDYSLKWGPVALPGGGRGGNPTIADFDGDGQPEIGVAGASRYVVFDGNGAILWAAVVQDGSSNMTGSSVFDFEGDGVAEVVYRDETTLRVFRGTDGAVLWSVPMSSCTWNEYISVADVDGDGSAEILAHANNNCGFGPQRGVFVYGAQSWVPTRAIWNQFCYHITNVDDDGTIPLNERENWLTVGPNGLPFNSYRQNVLTCCPPTIAADPTACDIVPPCLSSNVATVRIGNGGGIFAPATMPVSLYDGVPGQGGVLLGTLPVGQVLQPGDFVDLPFTIANPGALTGPITGVADDLGTGLGIVREANELNNRHDVALCATNAALLTYGAGWPGTLGVPHLTMDAAPRLGASANLLVDNSLGAPTAAAFLIGTPTSVPTAFGGTLLVAPFVSFTFVLPAGTAVPYPGVWPCRPELCGVQVWWQVVEIDAGASHGISFTPGLAITLGR
ncbi:MAG: VCBS repeat-containing protein [Planctomycetes bacterium]|nr:VCBS repeat-containing protein [Planctomycetota bacterium]